MDWAQHLSELAEALDSSAGGVKLGLICADDRLGACSAGN